MIRQRSLLAGLAAGALVLACGAGDSGDPASDGGPAARRLPVRYAADRFFATPVTASGDTVIFFTDTGGGANMIWPRAAARLGLEPAWATVQGDSVRTLPFPAFRPGAAIPRPAGGSPIGRRLLVTEPPGAFESADGFLGRLWFADRVWAFDYPGRTLALLEAHAPSSRDSAHRVALGFQTDSVGDRTTHFPRITVAIAGDSVDLLFDTGATVTLTEEALAELGDGRPAERGTSFIARSVFERWRDRHPEWRVVERADRSFHEPMIEVPRISVAGHTVGPVWFTVRPDASFHDRMSRWMDRTIDGALGGSGLRYFRVIVDYPRAEATFLRPASPSSRAGSSGSGPAAVPDCRVPASPEERGVPCVPVAVLTPEGRSFTRGCRIAGPTGLRAPGRSVRAKLRRVGRLLSDAACRAPGS